MKKESVRMGKPRQATALIRKAVSFQKRQWFTNLSVVVLCPFILVFLAGFGGSMIIALIQSATPIKEYLYCSNQPAMNEINIPIWGLKDSRLPTSSSAGFKGATMDQITHANFAYVTGLFGLTGPPGALAASYTRPCVRWFGKEYPKSELYERDAGIASAITDSANLAQPLGGWLNVIREGNKTLVDPITINVFQGSQLKAASLVAYGSDVDERLLGIKPKQSVLPPLVLDQSPASLGTILSSNSSGLLGTIPTQYFGYLGFKNATGGPSLLALQPTPWYNISNGSPDDLDDKISEALDNVFLELAKIPKEQISSNKPEDFNRVFLQVAEILQDLPHGAIYFNKIDHAKKIYAVDYHIGTDVRIKAASNFPPPGPRILYQLTQLSNSILKQSNTSRFSTAQITQGNLDYNCRFANTSSNHFK